MDKWQELFAQAELKLAAIDELTDIEEINRLTDEAAELMELAEAKKSASASRAKIRQPAMPASLPSDDGDGNQPQTGPEVKAVDPVYQIRYGEEGSAIKAVLRDLHGENYEQKRWDHYQGFVKYLRTGKGESREFVWTPESVKTALIEGLDVKAMKTVMVEAVDTLGGYNYVS
uniref:Uncharacterized protein n=1 Tax=viral metagenome TaxID=1070528 RepID=A0A6M3KQB0_9ZZZZ